jgi:hypothetical protein
VSKLSEKIALVLGAQVAEGTILTSVRDATIIANIDDGSALSAGEALGLLIDQASLKAAFARIEELGEDFPGTLSKSTGDFIRSEMKTFTFDVVTRGGGKALDGTPSAGDYNLPAAIEMLLSGFGIVRGTEGTGSTTYPFDEPVPLTFKLWRGNTSFTVQDCFISKLEYNLGPQGVVKYTVTVATGEITRDSSDTFPTSIDYGLQKTTKAPVLDAAGAQIGSTVRGFLDGKLTLDNAYTRFPDSNLVGGSNERTGRTVSWAGSFYVDSTDVDQDFANMIRTSTFQDLSFTLGTHVVTGVANALSFAMRNVNFTDVEIDQRGKRVIYKIAGYATTDGAGDDEFLLTSV